MLLELSETALVTVELLEGVQRERFVAGFFGFGSGLRCRSAFRCSPLFCLLRERSVPPQAGGQGSPLSETPTSFCPGLFEAAAPGYCFRVLLSYITHTQKYQAQLLGLLFLVVLEGTGKYFTLYCDSN